MLPRAPQPFGKLKHGVCSYRRSLQQGPAVKWHHGARRSSWSLLRSLHMWFWSCGPSWCAVSPAFPSLGLLKGQHPNRQLDRASQLPQLLKTQAVYSHKPPAADSCLFFCLSSLFEFIFFENRIFRNISFS